MKPELQEELFHRFPKIFAQHSLPMTKTLMCWGIDCGDGWFALIDALCERLQFWTDNNEAPQIEAVQVKEKYGRLCFYVSCSNEIQQGMIYIAESLAERTCEICGQPGRRIHAGWIKTRCEAHADQ